MRKNRLHIGSVAAAALLLLLVGPIDAQPGNPVMNDAERTLTQAKDAQSWVEKLHDETDEVFGGAAERLLRSMEMQLELCETQGNPVAPCGRWQKQIDELQQKLDRLQKIDPEEATKRIKEVRKQLEADSQELKDLPEQTPGLAELKQKVLDELGSLKSRFEGRNGLPEKVKRKLTRLRKGTPDGIDTDELRDMLDELHAKGCCTDSPEGEPKEGGEPAEEGDMPGAEPAEGDDDGGEPGAGGDEGGAGDKEDEGDGDGEDARKKALKERIERLKEEYEEETGRTFDEDAEKPLGERKKIDEGHDGLLWKTKDAIDQLEDELEELDQRLTPEEARKRWEEFVEDVRTLKGILEKDGHDPEFLDDFLEELEEQRREWDEAPTQEALERLKQRLKRRMGGQDEFTPEELDEYLDKLFGSAFEGEDSPAGDGTEDRRSQVVPPEAREVDDVIDLGTLERRLYDFPITAANTSCRGRHDFRATFEPAAQTPGGWFQVGDPQALSDIGIDETKTVQAKVDLRTVEAGALEGVLQIVCTTCPPPPVCTQNEKVFLVRATVQD